SPTRRRARTTPTLRMRRRTTRAPRAGRRRGGRRGRAEGRGGAGAWGRQAIPEPIVVGSRPCAPCGSRSARPCRGPRAARGGAGDRSADGGLLRGGGALRGHPLRADDRPALPRLADLDATALLGPVVPLPRAVRAPPALGAVPVDVLA